MAPIPGTRLVLTLLLGVIWSGCLGDPALPVERFALDEPHAFSAIVRSTHTGTTGYINLSGPVRLADNSGAMVDAYLYEQAIPFEGEYQRLYHYLDGDLREIARALGCGYTFLSCAQYKDWSWANRGDIGRDGLGHPEKITRGDFATKRGGHEAPIDWDGEIDAQDRLVLRIHRPYVSDPDSVEEYRYTEGRALPDGPRFSVEAYEDLGPLPPIPALMLPSPPLEARAWNGLMFPGEDEDPFGIGATHAEIARFVLRDFPQDADPCVQAYRLEPTVDEDDDGLPVIVPTYGQEATATGEISIVNGDKKTTFQLTVYRNLLNGTISMARTSGHTGDAPFSCDEMRRSPWPSTDFDSARETASALLAEDDLSVFEYGVGYKARNQDQPAEHGWHTYRFQFKPERAGQGMSGLWDPYTVLFEASGPLLTVRALAPPNATFER